MLPNNEQCILGPLPGVLQMGGPVLMLSHIHYGIDLPHNTKYWIIKGLSLAIMEIKNKPQIISLLGPSGVGKTTLLRIIAGLDRPTLGRVLVANEFSAKLQAVQVGKVGFVFQKCPLFEHLTVIQNLVEPAVHTKRVTKAEANDRANYYLNRFGLIDQRHYWPAQLSGGQRQRLAILQQLMTEKRFIVLDEPFSGLDPLSIRIAIELIQEIAYQHTLNTFLIATHDISAALSISDHVYLLGREHNEQNLPIAGARIVRKYNLINEGLAYQAGIQYTPKFMALLREITEADFPQL